MEFLNVKTYPNAQEAALYAGFALNKILEEQDGKPTLLLLSGGSALSLLEGVNSEYFGEHLTVSMVDERFSQDAAVNNFLQLQKTDFYKDAHGKDANFFGTLPRDKETPGQLAQRWERNLRQWRQDNPLGKIFATLGMGPDGHTAGIMPFPENAEKFARLFESQTWIAAYDAAGKNPHPQRVTATVNFLKQLNGAIAYIAGKEKQIPFDRLRHKQNTAAELPAMVFWSIGNLEIHTDLQ